MPRRAPLCRWVLYFPRMSASLLLMEANSSRCASVSASSSQAAILFSRPSAPANAQPRFSSLLHELFAATGDMRAAKRRRPGPL
jgi:hypothetical protein